LLDKQEQCILSFTRSIVRNVVKKALFIVLLIDWFIFPAPLLILAATERGQEPGCEEHCLANHSEVMQKLSEELAKTGNTLAYHEQVEREVSRYSACVTNCRLPVPVK
jgi:hypothetical protein